MAPASSPNRTINNPTLMCWFPTVRVGSSTHAAAGWLAAVAAENGKCKISLPWLHTKYSTMYSTLNRRNVTFLLFRYWHTQLPGRWYWQPILCNTLWLLLHNTCTLFGVFLNIEVDTFQYWYIILLIDNRSIFNDTHWLICVDKTLSKTLTDDDWIKIHTESLVIIDM